MSQQTNGELIADIIAKHADVFLIDLADWLGNSQNWAIWGAFEYQANGAWKKGFKRYSARTIGEYLRHHSALHASGTEFKLNDHIWPDLARLYMLAHPDRAGFFECRQRRAA